MAKSLRTTTSSVTGTVTAPTGLAIGDVVTLIGWSDTASATLTPPSDGNTWTPLVMGSEAGTAFSTLGAWRSTIASVPASFTVAGATIGGTICAAINPGGETLGTPIVTALVTTVGGTVTSVSTAVNSAADSVTYICFSNDDDNVIDTPPSGMTQEAYPTVSAGELALYSILDANNATYSNTMTWTSVGTERMNFAVTYPFTNAGPTIDTQPTAGTVVLNNDSRTSKTFTSAATTSCGTLIKRGQFEDSVGSGTYTDLTEGGIWANVATDAVMVTPTTKTGITGRRFRHRYTDDNGTTYTDPVMLTVYNGVILSAASAVTDASGIATITYTTDLPVTANGAFNKFAAVCDGATSRTSGRPS